MSDQPANPRRELNDPALWPLIESADDPARETAIESIVRDVVKPLIGSLVARFRRAEPSLRLEDVEELSSVVVLRVIRKLRATALFEEHAIAVLENYVATLTYHTLYDLRRQRYPERHRLKKNLRYLFTRDPRLALWETPTVVAAGLKSWNGTPSVLASTSIMLPRVAPEMANRDQPADALVAIVRAIGAPVAFDALVDVVADLWHVRDVVLEEAEFPPDGQRDQLSSLEQRQYMEALWAEIRQLPANQRAALLLNLRDAAGGNAVTLFLLLEIATPDEIAAAAGISEVQLNELWEELPLDDLTIAARLSLTRQQVINLRKSARSRLSRRMSGWK